MLRIKWLQVVLGLCVGVSVVFLLQDSRWAAFSPLKDSKSSVPLIPTDDYVDDDPQVTTSQSFAAEDEEDDLAAVAPRSHPGAYNEFDPSQQYILYHPSGGFSNQRMELEYAVEIGKLLNRTVYVPMCGRHTNGWAAYNALKEGEDLFPMDRILDFPFLQSYEKRVRLVPLNITVSRFITGFMKQYGEDSVLSIVGSRKFYGRAQVVKWRQYKQPIMFFKGAGFFHRWFPETTLVEIRKHVRFTKYIRDLAIKVAKEALGDKFYAMHIRMGDYAYRQGDDASNFLRRAQAMNWNLKQVKVYVATEPNRHPAFFAPLLSNMKVVFSDQLPKELVQDFRKAFPKGRIRNDMLGLLEQLIAVQSKSFIGTYFSTFSAFILFMRTNKAELFPEITNLEISDEKNDPSLTTPKDDPADYDEDNDPNDKN